MFVLAVNGSPRVKGNTAAMLSTVLEICESAGMKTELYQAGGKPVRGCLACGGCEKHPGRCSTDDWMNELYGKMVAADAILLGSPTYYSDVTPEIKAVIDRCGFLAGHDGRRLARKVGAAVSPVRRAGSIHTLDSMQHWFLINDMIMPGSTYWNMSIARDIDAYQRDEEGVATMRTLGENIVWLLGKLKS